MHIFHIETLNTFYLPSFIAKKKSWKNVIIWRSIALKQPWCWKAESKQKLKLADQISVSNASASLLGYIVKYVSDHMEILKQSNYSTVL